MIIANGIYLSQLNDGSQDGLQVIRVCLQLLESTEEGEGDWLTQQTVECAMCVRCVTRAKCVMCERCETCKSCIEVCLWEVQCVSET